MATPRHKVVFIKDHYKVKDPVSGEFKTADTSTLYIRSYQPKGGQQHKKVSLEIRLKNSDIKSFWDPSRLRFKDIKKNPNAQEWNDKIESELKKITNYSDLSNVPQKRKSFMKYWDDYITNTDKHGTRIKHEVVKNKLNKFLKGADLYFSEITPELVRSIYHNFKTAKNPKRLSIGTANHYMKIIHGMLNVAKEARYYNYDIDPFIGLQYNAAEEPVLEGKVIEGVGLKLLLDADAPLDMLGHEQRPFPADLQKYRLSLLFQMFANGMRVSDMLTLRWNNFDGYVLRYNMFKTGKSMKIPMNLNLINILCKIILLENPKSRLLSYIPRFVNGQHTATIKLANKTIEWNLGKIEKRLSEINEKHVDYHPLMAGRDELVEKLERNISMDICIWYRNRKKDNDFVFPYLNNEDFIDIGGDNNFNHISEPQYKKIKHNTIVYNRNLKKIKDLIGFNGVNLTSHTARHSFASFLLGMGDVNTFDIQQMLGHSSIQITDKYLQKHFNPKKLDTTNRRLSKQFVIK